MRKLTSFTSVSLDGFFTDEHGDMSWAHGRPDDGEWNAFVSGNASGGGALVFGRKTYELMAGYWPTPMAAEQNPTVADGMNQMPKYVFSKTMAEADWANTTVLKGDLAEEARNLKAQDGPGLAILGSGSIVSQLAEARLIDQLQIVIVPLAIGKGRSLFSTLGSKLPFKLTDTRSFQNGNVVLTYEPG